MSVSAYLITNGSQIYLQLRHSLKFFERAHTKESVWRPQTIPEDHILLLGCDRTGRALLPVLKQENYPLLIVDSNPKVINSLIADGFSAAYGDTTDLDLLDEIHLDKARLVISTVPDLTDNLMIMEKIKHLPSRPLFIVIAEHPKQALQLYEAGADYVLVPRLLTGAHLARLLAHHEGKSFFTLLKKKQLPSLTQNFST